MAKRIKFEGKVYQFPDETTDDQISEQLASEHDRNQPNAGLAPPSGNPRTGNVHEWDMNPDDAASTYFPNEKPRKDNMGNITPHSMPGASDGSNLAEGLSDWTDNGPIEVGRGAMDVGRGNVSRGAHKMISGAGVTMAPAVLPFAATAAPLATATSMGTGYLAGKVARPVAEHFGASPDQADLAEDLGNIGGGLVGTKVPRMTGSLARGAASALPTAVDVVDKLATPFGLRGRAARYVANSPRINQMVPQVLNKIGDKLAPKRVPPNVFPGEALPSAEPELPATRPDGQSHFNDVVDQGEMNKLLDEVNGVDQARTGREPVRADDGVHHDDVSVPEGIGPEAPDELMRQPVGQRPMPPSADDTPTPNSDTLQRAIKSAPGWPENGQPNLPVDELFPGPDSELTSALDTDPYNRPSAQGIQTDQYTGPDRRSPFSRTTRTKGGK